MRRAPLRPLLVALVALGITSAPARSDSALVAVSANFAGAAEMIARDFAEATEHTVMLTTGSTGKLYAQIGAGAPFEVMLSADAETPARLMAEGKAVPGSAFTYAFGRLTLWSADPDRIGRDGEVTLSDPGLRYLAIANPDLAPYGQAAKETLHSLDMWAALRPKIVMGQNVGQTQSMVATGAAEIGFVGLSGVIASDKGSRWDVPQALHAPIRQDAVLLTAGDGNAAARAFLTYLQGPAAAEVIARFGYGGGA